MIAPLPEPKVDRQARIPHVAALDGLRGIAVVGVLVFHADHLQGGFLGVDLFFTLSGFLITSLLVVEQQRTGGISLREFWARRARRLLPAMLAMVAVATVVAAVTLPDAELSRFGRQALATLAYVANWGEIASSRDYWALFDAPTPLEHVWSLAIEEQFYVVWPLLVLGAVRLLESRIGIRALVALGLAGSLAASWIILAGDGGTTRAYYGTDTRAASILVGAGLATFTAGTHRRPSSVERGVGVAAAVALPALLASWTFINGTEMWLYPWGFLAHAVLTSLIVAAVCGPLPGRLGSLLARRALVHVGVLSYGLYLWHWPVYVVLDEARTGLDGWLLTAVRLAVSFAIATASFHLIEAPIRSQRWTFRRPGLLAVGAVAATAVVVIAVAWVPGADDTARTSELALAGEGSNAVATGFAGTVLVVGDSGPATMAEQLVASGRERGLEVRVEAQIGCGLVGAGEGVHTDDGGFLADPEGCDRWPERWAKFVEELRPDAVLLMLAWGGGGDRDVGGGTLVGPCAPEFDRYYEEQVRRAVDVLGSTGAVVVLATTPPHASERGLDKRTACLNEIYQSATEIVPAELLDLAGWTCAQDACVGDDQDPRRPDGTHFAGVGAEQAARWIVDETSRLTDLDGMPFLVFVGDSQALRLVQHAPPFSDLDLRVGSLAALGCGLSTQSVVMDGRDTGKEECVPTLDSLVAEVDSLEPDAVVVHAGAWESLDQLTVDGRVRFGQPGWEPRLRANVAETLRRLAAPGRRLIALTTPCFADGPGRDAFGTEDLDARIAAYNDVLVQEVLRLGGAVVDLAERLCPEGEPVLEIDGTTVRPDGVHTDPKGARVLWPWLAEELRAALVRD